MKTIRETLMESVQAAAKGKSTNQLATELEIDVAALYRWMSGERTISIVTAEKLAKHFGLELRPVPKRGRK